MCTRSVGQLLDSRDLIAFVAISIWSVPNKMVRFCAAPSARVVFKLHTIARDFRSIPATCLAAPATPVFLVVARAFNISGNGIDMDCRLRVVPNFAAGPFT